MRRLFLGRQRQQRAEETVDTTEHVDVDVAEDISETEPTVDVSGVVNSAIWQENVACLQLIQWRLDWPRFGAQLLHIFSDGKDGLLIPVKLGSREISALLDSGSDLCIVRRDCLNEQCLRDCETVKIHCVHGDVKDYQTLLLLLTYRGRHFKVWSAVLDLCPWPLLIGRGNALFPKLIKTCKGPVVQSTNELSGGGEEEENEDEELVAAGENLEPNLDIEPDLSSETEEVTPDNLPEWAGPSTSSQIANASEHKPSVHQLQKSVQHNNRLEADQMMLVPHFHFRYPSPDHLHHTRSPTSQSPIQLSLLAFASMAVLALLEFLVYRDTWMSYEYEVDKDFTSKLRINIDITVAMRCQYVGADVLDLAETMVSASDGLKYEPVIFDLSPQQKIWQRGATVAAADLLLPSDLEASRFLASVQHSPDRDLVSPNR
ncbi:ERGI2 protein, partial [Polypterus senegalus]